MIDLPVAPAALPASCAIAKPAVIRPAEHSLLRPGGFPRVAGRAERRAILADLVRAGRLTREQAQAAVIFIPWIASPTGGISTTISTSDIAAWWDYDDGSGSTVTDKSSGGHDGAVNGATWTTGGPTSLDAGLTFTSNNNVRYTGYTPVLTAGTICAWFNSTSMQPGGHNGPILSASNGSNRPWQMVTDTGDTLGGVTYSSGSYTEIQGGSVSAGTLYFGCFGWDFSGTPASEVWVNGSSVATGAPTGTLATPTNDLMTALRAPGDTTINYRGDIFQIILLNRKITTTEVGQLYNSGAGGAYEDFAFAT